MVVVGLVGAMGAGKTYVLDLMADCGVVTIRADDVSRELVLPNSRLAAAIRDEFGSEYFNAEGKLRRQELGRLIFSDENARLRLNRLMYPALKAALSQKLSVLDSQPYPPEMAAVEAANLFEMEADCLTDVTVNVRADRDVRIRRLQQRDNISRTEARSRIDSQAAAGLDRPDADMQIETDTADECFCRQIKVLCRQLLNIYR